MYLCKPIVPSGTLQFRYDCSRARSRTERLQGETKAAVIAFCTNQHLANVKELKAKCHGIQAKKGYLLTSSVVCSSEQSILQHHRNKIRAICSYCSFAKQCIHLTADDLGLCMYELNDHSCDVINHTLLLHKPPLVCLIHQLQPQITESAVHYWQFRHSSHAAQPACMYHVTALELH